MPWFSGKTLPGPERNRLYDKPVHEAGGELGLGLGNKGMFLELWFRVSVTVRIIINS